jgi:toxin CcdB
MAQFDVHRNPGGGEFPFVVDVQSELLATLSTRIVVPMTRKTRHAKLITRLNPVATVRGVDYVLVVQEMAAIPTTALGEVVGSLKARRAELVAAIDMLFTGL